MERLMLDMYLKRLRELREDNDLSQEKMGQILNVSQRTYSRYENNERAIPLEALIDFADYFKVTLDYLTERTDIK